MEKEKQEATVSKERAIKFLSDILPMVTVIILVTGIIKQYLYYLNFNLPIKYFISLSEIGLNISDNLLIIIPILVVFYFLANWYFIWLEKRNEISAQPESKLLNKVPKRINCGKIIIPILLLVSFFLFFWTDDFILKLNTSSIIVSLIFLFYTFYFLESTWKYFKNDKQFIYLILFTLFLNVFILLTGQELESVEKGKYTGTTITTADSTIYESNDTAYFIGKTEKYVFFYNKNRKSTSIIPTDQITKMELFSK